MADTSKRLGWKAVSYAAGALSAVAVQRLLTVGWTRLRAEPPPDNAADRDLPLLPALTWAVATGVGIGVVRLLAVRSAARAWEAATNEAPPVAA